MHHAMCQRKRISLHHRSQAHNSCTSPPLCAKWSQRRVKIVVAIKLVSMLYQRYKTILNATHTHSTPNSHLNASHSYLWTYAYTWTKRDHTKPIKLPKYRESLYIYLAAIPATLLETSTLSRSGPLICHNIDTLCKSPLNQREST